MTEYAKEENLKKKLWLNSLKLFLKIALIMIAMFFFVIAILFYLAPKVDAKIFNFFGLTKVEEKCYEQIYKNSGKTSDLYNLIIFDMDHGYIKNELENITKIYEAKDYAEFCTKLDASGVQSANGNKSLYCYVADTHAFFKNQEIKCVLELGLKGKLDDWKNRTIKIAIDGLSEQNLTDVSFDSLMSTIVSTEKLNFEEKKSFLNLMSEKVSNGQELNDLIEMKLNIIKTAFEECNDNEVQKILLKNAEVKLLAGAYYFEMILNNGQETSIAEQIKQNHTVAFSEYKNLIK